MRRALVTAGAVAVLVIAGATTVAAVGASQPVECTVTDNVLTCPLPVAPPVTTTETATATVTATETQAPVTNTVTPAPVTTTATVTAPPVTVTAAPTTTTPTVTPPVTTTTTTSTPVTTTPPPPASAFPDATNTGVPAGTVLTAYTGSCSLTTANAVYDAKTFNCDVIVKAAGIKITRSRVNGRLSNSTTGASVTVSDSLIDGGQQETFPAVSYQNLTLTRVNVIGGQHSVQCWDFCTVTDSWLHNQYLPSNSAGHVNAYISNGGGNNVLRHNTLACTVTATNSGGGCTADASMFGDFDPIGPHTFDNNLFKATTGGYCTQAGYNPGKKYPNPSGIKYTNNVFERGTNRQCGQYGPVTAFNSASPGAVWTGNTWSDGAPLN